MRGDDWPEPIGSQDLARATARALEEARDTGTPRYVQEVVMPVGPKDAPLRHDVIFGVYSAADLEDLRGRLAEAKQRGVVTRNIFTLLRLVHPDGRIEAL